MSVLQLGAALPMLLQGALMHMWYACSSWAVGLGGCSQMADEKLAEPVHKREFSYSNERQFYQLGALPWLVGVFQKLRILTSMLMILPCEGPWAATLAHGHSLSRQAKGFEHIFSVLSCVWAFRVLLCTPGRV